MNRVHPDAVPTRIKKSVFTRFMDQQYEETEHYRVMRQFILDPKRMLHLLLKDPA